LSVLENFAPYAFKPGMVSTSRELNNNALGSTGLTWALLAIKGDYVPWQEMRDVIALCQVRTGLYRRLPYPGGGMQSADDYFGLVAGLALNHCVWEVRDILAYGRAHRWVMNSEAPDSFQWRAWFGRFPALIAHIVYGSCNRPNLFLRTAWALAVAWASTRPAKEQDSYVQTWCMVAVYQRQPYFGFLQTTAAMLFLHRLTSLGGLGRILEDYTQLPGHPLVQLARKVA
jgi:hypothetical protein